MVMLSGTSARERKQESIKGREFRVITLNPTAGRTLFANKAEILFEDGSKRYFRCTQTNKQKALKEIANFVKSMEMETGQRIAWKMPNEKFYRLGSQLKVEGKSFKARVKKCMEYFFELD